MPVEFITNPAGAKIYIDSQDTLSITPSSIVVLAGQHMYILSKDGYLDVIGYITVEDLKFYQVNATMQSVAYKLYESLIKIGWFGVGLSAIALLWSRRGGQNG